MRIFSLNLKNFRQYKGEKEINFVNSDGKNFTIIQGPNGAGKTNLMNALTWCLYGQEKHLSKLTHNEQLRPVNNKAISEIAPGDSIEMSVTIVLGNQIPEYRIRRSLHGYKDREGFATFDEKDDFSVLWRDGKDWKHVASGPNYFVNMILPHDIHDFFFFDGEKLDDFFRPGSESNIRIRNAIMKVSQVHLLDRAKEHLDGIESKLRRLTKGENPDIERKRNEIERNKQLLDAANEDLLKKERDKKYLRINIESIEEKLKNYPVDKIQKLQIERENLEAEKKRLEADLEEKKLNSISSLIEQAPFVYCRTAITKTSDLINEKYKKGDLPPKIRETYLREILDSGICICGNDVTHDSPYRKNIESLVNSVQLSKLDETITDGKFEIQAALSKGNEFLSERTMFGTAITDLDDRIAENAKALEDISQQIQKDEAEDVVILEGNRKRLDSEERALIDLVGRRKAEIDQLKFDFKQAKDEYDKELSKSKKFESIRKQLELCEQSEDIIISIKNQVLNDVKGKIQEKTREYFLNLIWKRDTFKDVKIDDNYNIYVVHKGGWDALPVLSAGEREVLALSFMAALRESANVDAPVVIDTPLARISGEPKENIAEMLPIYLKNCQVILFVTDQEYTPAVRQRLAKCANAEYKLLYDEQSEETQLIPYGG
jgi:DNA sulfur modification protein DndD